MVGYLDKDRDLNCSLGRRYQHMHRYLISIFRSNQVIRIHSRTSLSYSKRRETVMASHHHRIKTTT